MEKLIRAYNKIFYYICFFYIYSFAGWVIETVYVSLIEYRLANRGFLYGPLCPVYGFGFLFVLIILKPINKNTALTFIAAGILTTILEYCTGFILESVFQARLWDYSNDMFNIKGRISLKTSLAWSFASVIFLEQIHPRVCEYAGRIPEKYRAIISYFALLYLVADLSVSSAVRLGSVILAPIFSMYLPF